MSRAHLFDRARRLVLRISLRARPEAGPDGVWLYSLVLVAGEVSAKLVAHVRCFARRRSGRRAKASLPAPKDVRQQGLFSWVVSNRGLAAMLLRLDSRLELAEKLTGTCPDHRAWGLTLAQVAQVLEKLRATEDLTEGRRWRR
ncbi:hypothetical protein [Paraburkholderia sp. SG-MS1]|uniref:hypothetical protein n=1 Tax=Paraburkholderia sp. SG-MS1 TaxID=2023741 RepID=UPI001581256B|nr:hypothetical protein [Paraburkholderia sp. SG-MS1]